jgi:hypothetical protein
MNKNTYIILTLLIISSFTYTKTSFHDKIKFIFQRNHVEKIDQKELPATHINSLCLTNNNGSITIKTGPKKSIFLRTVKRAKKENLFNTADVVIEKNSISHLTITTKDRNKKSMCSIDYELIVPASLDIALNIAGNGNVFIKDMHGTIDVVANDNITIMNSKRPAAAQTLKKGAITIINAAGPIEAYTQQGNIFGENIADSFEARSISGKMNICCKKIPSTSFINLSTTTGNIVLALPADTNAEISGQTLYGTLLSEHDITLKSFTTKLNKTAWTKFTKEVDGFLGTGDASIMVNSTRGNVKIVETTA